jgi:NDP-sugar pyrophosphorylase family protein
MTERAVILAGGRGSRLAPYTAILPKPLMPLTEGKSIIEHVLTGISSAGISDVTITLGYMGHLIEAIVGGGEQFGLRVDYTREDHPLGTAGPLSMLEDVSAGDRILVVNGDTFTDLDYREVLDQLQGSVEAVITCVERTINIDYGVVQFDTTGHLANYDEKPEINIVVSTGIYGLRGSSLDLVQPGKRMDMPDLLRALQVNDRPVACYLSDCEWKDLGRPEDFTALHQQLLSNTD